MQGRIKKEEERMQGQSAWAWGGLVHLRIKRCSVIDPAVYFSNQQLIKIRAMNDLNLYEVGLNPNCPYQNEQPVQSPYTV